MAEAEQQRRRPAGSGMGLSIPLPDVDPMHTIPIQHPVACFALYTGGRILLRKAWPYKAGRRRRRRLPPGTGTEGLGDDANDALGCVRPNACRQGRALDALSCFQLTDRHGPMHHIYRTPHPDPTLGAGAEAAAFVLGTTSAAEHPMEGPAPEEPPVRPRNWNVGIGATDVRDARPIGRQALVPVRTCMGGVGELEERGKGSKVGFALCSQVRFYHKGGIPCTVALSSEEQAAFERMAAGVAEQRTVAFWQVPTPVPSFRTPLVSSYRTHITVLQFTGGHGPARDRCQEARDRRRGPGGSAEEPARGARPSHRRWLRGVPPPDRVHGALGSRRRRLDAPPFLCGSWAGRAAATTLGLPLPSSLPFWTGCATPCAFASCSW